MVNTKKTTFTLSYEPACHYGLEKQGNNDIGIRQVINSAITAKTTKARKKGPHELANTKELLRERTASQWVQSNKQNKIVLNADTSSRQGSRTQLETQNKTGIARTYSFKQLGRVQPGLPSDATGT